MFLIDRIPYYTYTVYRIRNINFDYFIKINVSNTVYTIIDSTIENRIDRELRVIKSCYALTNCRIFAWRITGYDWLKYDETTVCIAINILGLRKRVLCTFVCTLLFCYPRVRVVQHKLCNVSYYRSSFIFFLQIWNWLEIQ